MLNVVGVRRFLFFPALDGLFHECGRIPLGKKHAVVVVDQPFLKKLKLCRFSRTVNSLDDDESAGVRMRCVQEMFCHMLLPLPVIEEILAEDARRAFRKIPV